jgi:hypothetical protein
MEAWYFDPEPKRTISKKLHEYLESEMLSDAGIYLSVAAQKH